MNKLYKNPGRIVGIIMAMLLSGILSLTSIAQSVSFVRTVSTLVGSTSGNTDGAIADAKFNFPYATAVDGGGNVYVADYNNHRIRKITPLGTVSTLAGSTAGFANGVGTSAQFNYPTGVAVDGSGNVYVADRLNQCIRMITSGGTVTTYAGSTAGFTNGTGTAAKFNNPVSVAVDASGNVYVGDQSNHSIRKITAGGVVTTLAGSGTAGYAEGTGTAASFNNPYGVAVDASDNVYVADQANQKIRKITSGGETSTLAGSTSGFADGTGSAAMFYNPYGLALDADNNLYVVDYYNQSIRRVTQAGVVSTIAGNGNGVASLINGLGPSARFNNPNGIASDIYGNLYVADVYNFCIRKITNPVLNSFSTTYGIASASQTFSVMGTGLTGDAVVTAPAGYEVSLTGTTYSSSINITPASGKVTPKTVYIRLSSTAPGGAANGNIALSTTGGTTEYLPVTGTVTKIDQTITFNTLTPISYSNGAYNPGATSSSGLAITYTSDNNAVATASGSTVTIVGVGTVNITASQAGNQTYNAATDVTRQLTVNKASQTITFPSLSVKIVGDSDFDAGAISSSGLPLTYSIPDPTVATISGSIVTIVGTGTTNIIATQAGDNNYLSATSSIPLVVKENQTITFGALTPITYANGPYDPGATSSSSLNITYTSDNLAVATTSGSTVTIVGAGTVHLTANQSGNRTYIAAVPVTQQLIVGKADQTISNFTTLPVKTVGDSPFDLTGASASSGLAVSYTSDNISVAAISANGHTVTIVGAGTATITATQEGNGNYNAAAPVSLLFTVNKADQTITFDPFNPATYGDPNIILNLNASSGLPVTYTSSDNTVATVSGNVVTIVGAGTADITASRTGDANYNDALPVMRTLIVDKANSVITFTLPAKTMVDPSFDLDNLASSNSPVALTFTSDNLAVATIDGNNVVTIVGVGSANITVSQAANTNYNAAADVVRQLVVSKASQTITFNIPAKTVSDADFDLDQLASTTSLLALTFTSDNAAVATVDPLTNIVTIHGAGTANITASQAGDADYSPASLVRQLVVSLAAQTITFNTIPDAFDNSPDFTLNATTTSGLTITYTSSNLSVATIVNGNTVHIVGVGSTNITASQPGDATFSAAPDVTRGLIVHSANGIKPMIVSESKIYPNPTEDVFMIEPKRPLYGELKLTISDMHGKVVYSSKEQEGEDSYKIDISGLQNGVYLLELSDGKQMISQRIIKK